VTPETTTTTSSTTTTTSTTIPPVPSGASGAAGGDGLVPSITTTSTTLYNVFSPGSTVPIASSGGTTVRCDRETGSIRGRGRSEDPQIGLLNDDALSRAIQVGDQVITAGGTDSIAPPNLPVGRVSRVVQRRGDAPVVEVRVNADLVHLNFVEVLLYLPVSEVSG
jgi:rod shape-determining protein MreC